MEQIAKREVIKGIFKTEPVGNGQVKSIKTGEKKIQYTYKITESNDTIEINGKKYKVVNDREFAYKIQKTQIKAISGAKGLLRLFTEFEASCMDYIEQSIFENVKPIN